MDLATIAALPPVDRGRLLQLKAAKRQADCAQSLASIRQQRSGLWEARLPRQQKVFHTARPELERLVVAIFARHL